jgi:hypothetical protein
MPIERPVSRYPIPKTNWQPAASTPYPVRGSNDKYSNDRDTWISIARQNNMDVMRLIRFNFMTENTDEINWYLRRNVGCNIPSRDGLNWAFSDSADPGIIYIPHGRIDMEPEIVTTMKTISPFALEFEGPSAPLEKIGTFFDALTLIDIAATIGGVAVGELALLGIGIVTAPFAAFMAMGGMHEAALNDLRAKQIRRGLALGMVLTAAGRDVQYISSHGYVMKSPVSSTQYPQYGKQLQGIYNVSLKAGIIHGRQFNTVARKALWIFISMQLTDYARNEYSGDRNKWSPTKWWNWYNICAAILEQKITFK